MSDSALVREMLALELQLLHGDHGRDSSEAEELLAPDFREVHAAGGLSSREEVLAWLRHKDPAARWAFADFEVRELAPGLRLVSYLARQVAPQPSASKGARHASLWRCQTGEPGWQLYFHQATRVV